MIAIADVFRRFAADYVSAHGASMLPSHRRAIEDIIDCRTAALGGQVWRCDTCSTEVFSYHSCGNRSCPKGHTAQTQEWLEHRQAEMLPVPYFHITVTVPAELREVLRANQRDGYAVLMQASAAAIIELARDPRYVGGTVGVLAVRHTWTQQLAFHPHVHCLVSGGGISEDGNTWHPARQKFLLSRLLQNWCAASSARYCSKNALISSSPRRCGTDPGSSMSPPGATASRRCSTISPATSFASL
jgi:transposase-like zinc-binding protein/putative transposase